MGRLIVKDTEDDSVRYFEVVEAGWDVESGMWFKTLSGDEKSTYTQDIHIEGITLNSSNTYLENMVKNGYLILVDNYFKYEEEKEN